MKAFPIERALLIALAAGLVPALAILLLVRFQNGSLIVLDQEIAEYSLGRLMATLTSIALPVLVLSPVAFHFGSRGARLPVAVTLMPVCLLVPALLAGLLVGGRGIGPPLAALLSLALWLICLQLWLDLLGRWLAARSLIVVYALIWAASDYLEHLRRYVLPYLEATWLQAMAWLWWLFPQVNSAPSYIDDYLQTGLFAWDGLLPTLIQIPLLAAIALIWRVPGRSSARADAEHADS